MAPRSSPRECTSIKCHMQQKEELDLCNILLLCYVRKTFPLFSNRVRKMQVDW